MAKDPHRCIHTKQTERPVLNHGSLGVKCHVSAQRSTEFLNVCTRTKINKNVQTWAKFMRVSSRLAKSRFEKHLDACIVPSHVVNGVRDACCPQSLT